MVDIHAEIQALKANGLKALGYCRISTEKEEGQSSLRRMIRALERIGCDEILSEQISGYQDRIRHKFEQGMKWIREGKYQIFIIPRIDRMGRQFYTNNDVEKEIAALGCYFYALDYGRVDTSTPSGWKDFQQASLYAEYESRVIQSRVLSAKADRKANLLPNTGRPAFGLKNSIDLTRLEIDPATYDIARSRIECFLECDGRIEKTLRLHTERTGERVCKTTYRKWMQNPMIRGHLTYGVRGGNPEVHFNTHEAIMTPDEWDIISKIFEDRRTLKGKNVNADPHPLRGLVWCDHCGSRLHQLSTHKGRYHYVIHRYDQIRELQCDRRAMIHYKDVCRWINEALSERANELIQQAFEPDDRPKSPLQIEKEAQLSVLIDTRRKTGLSDLDPVIENLEDEIDRMTQSDSDFNSKQSRLVEQIKTLSDPDVWGHATHRELRAIYVDLVREVRLDGDKLVSIMLNV